MATVSEAPREEEIDNDILIEEIEIGATLYKKELKEYSDVILKKRLWGEICEKLFPGKWERLTEQQQIKIRFDVQQRWKNIRACFARELRSQKNTKSGQAAQKRRKYIYFDKLLFLLPSMEMRSTSSNAAPVGGEEKDQTGDEATEARREELLPLRRNLPKKQSFEESLLQVLQEKKAQKNDQETNFALSLVPMLKALPIDKKIDAQIQMLQILKTLNSRLSEMPFNTHPRNQFTECFSPDNNNVSNRITSAPVPSPQNMPFLIIPSHTDAFSSTSPYCHAPSETHHQNTNSPTNSRDTIQSYISNFSVNSNDGH